jgi:hypothetical protein
MVGNGVATAQHRCGWQQSLGVGGEPSKMELPLHNGAAGNKVSESGSCYCTTTVQSQQSFRISCSRAMGNGVATAPCPTKQGSQNVSWNLVVCGA